MWELLRPYCEGGFIEARWVKGHLDAAAAAGRGITPEDHAGNETADRLAGAAARACLPARALCAGRQVQLHALRSVQRLLAAVELAALRANHESSGPAGPRVRRRWTGGPRLAPAARPNRQRAQQ